jgi:hypothetical protein
MSQQTVYRVDASFGSNCLCSLKEGLFFPIKIFRKINLLFLARRVVGSWVDGSSRHRLGAHRRIIYPRGAQQRIILSLGRVTQGDQLNFSISANSNS